MYSVHCAVCYVQCTVYSVLCTVCSVQGLMCSVRDIVHGPYAEGYFPAPNIIKMDHIEKYYGKKKFGI